MFELDVVDSGKLENDEFRYSPGGYPISVKSLHQPARQRQRRLSKEQLQQALDYLEGHLDQNIKLPKVATLLGMNLCEFCRSFAQSVGVPPYQYVIQRRRQQQLGIQV